MSSGISHSPGAGGAFLASGLREENEALLSPADASYASATYLLAVTYSLSVVSSSSKEYHFLV